MSVTDVVLRPEDQAVQGFELAERVFTPERREQVAQFLAIEPDDPALLPYLVVCATYGLSPIMGEIWLIPQKVKIKAKDGSPEQTVDRYKPAVGRDGYLSIARRDKRFAGMQSAVICEHDTYEVVYEGDLETDPKILHRFASKPTVFEEGDDPGRWRGKVLGAWAKCYIVGQPAVFYEASVREHGKLEQDFEWGDARGERRWVWLNPDGTRTFERTGKPALKWSGAWDYLSAMILKAAQSYVLRIGMGITGLAPADEMGRSLPDGQAPALLDEAVPTQTFDWDALDCSLEMRERLRMAVEAANLLAPMSWSAAKCEMLLVGLGEEELRAQAERIEREGELHSRAIDPPPSHVAPSASVDDHAGQVEDAEVVETRPAPLSDEQREHLDVLRHRQADLQAGVEAAEVGSEEHATLLSELDGVEAQIRRESEGPREQEIPPSGL